MPAGPASTRAPDLDRLIHERMRIPRPEYRLTDAGRAALARSLDHLEALIRATRER